MIDIIAGIGTQGALSVINHVMAVVPNADVVSAVGNGIVGAQFTKEVVHDIKANKRQRMKEKLREEVKEELREELREEVKKELKDEENERKNNKRKGLFRGRR